MFALCGALFIQAFTTDDGVPQPHAMFSPTVEPLYPVACTRVTNVEPSVPVWSK